MLLCSPAWVIKIDSITGFQSLRNDVSLQSYGITLDLGFVKNKNSKSIVDKAIQELELEFLKKNTIWRSYNQRTITVSYADSQEQNQKSGLSAKDILLQRDQITNKQLSVSDVNLSGKQDTTRKKNHLISAASKTPRGKVAFPTNLKMGDLVFIKDERSKYKARDRYIIRSIDVRYVQLQKLSSKFTSCKHTVNLSKMYCAGNVMQVMYLTTLRVTQVIMKWNTAVLFNLKQVKRRTEATTKKN